MARRQGGDAQGPVAEGVRLQKVLSQAGVSSRRGGEELIKQGRVRVNGVTVNELGTRVDPERDTIVVDGEPIAIAAHVYYVLNKPDGVVCSAEGPVDDRGRPTVLSLLPGVRERVYPVGRLDFHTRGVLILTNDGDLTALLTHPRYGVPKTYHVKFQGTLEPEVLQGLEQGVTLDDGVVTEPLDELFVVRETETNTWVQMTLHQGIHRQIRRMGDAVGHSVLKLIRVAVGEVTTDGLDEGELRRLTPAEVHDLRALAAPASSTTQRSGRRQRGRAGPGRRGR